MNESEVGFLVVFVAFGHFGRRIGSIRCRTQKAANEVKEFLIHREGVDALIVQD